MTTDSKKVIEKTFDLNTLTKKELIELFYSDIKEFRHNRAELLRKYLDLNKNETDKQRQKMIYELMLIDLHSKLNGERFAPMVVYTNNQKYPDLDTHFNEEAIEYYKQQVENVTNPILKSRYADFLGFKLRKEFNKYSLIAIDEYLKTIQIYLENEWELELIDSVIRALQLSLHLNNKDEIKKCIDIFELNIETLKENKKYLSIEKILLFIFENNKKIKIDMDKYIVLLKEISIYFKDNKNFVRERSILELICRIIKGTTDYEVIKLNIIKSFITEGNLRLESDKSQIGVISYFYEEATKIYLEFGKKYKTEINDLKHKILEFNRNSETNFKSIEHKFKIEKKQFDVFLHPYKDKEINELIAIFASDLRLIVNYNEAMKRAEENLKTSTILQIIPRKIMKEGYVIKTITPEMNLEYQSKWEYVFNLNFNKFFLNSVFELIENDKTHFDKYMADYLSESTIITGNRIELIGRGLERFREKDYISAIYILTFQIEGILRDFAFKMGIAIYKETSKIEMSAVLFSDLLKVLSQIKGFEEGFLLLIEIFLVDVLGLNLRNDLAHGLVERNIFTKENCEYLIFIILHISLYQINKKEKIKQ